MAKLTKKQKALEGKVDALKLHGVDEAIKLVRDLVENRMFPLTIAGLDQAMSYLSK